MCRELSSTTMLSTLAVECDLGDIETRRCTQWFNPTALHGPESHCLSSSTRQNRTRETRQANVLSSQLSDWTPIIQPSEPSGALMMYRDRTKKFSVVASNFNTLVLPPPQDQVSSAPFESAVPAKRRLAIPSVDECAPRIEVRRNRSCQVKKETEPLALSSS